MANKNSEILSTEDFKYWKKYLLLKLNQEDKEIVLSVLSGPFCKEKCLEAKIKFLDDSLLYFR